MKQTREEIALRAIHELASYMTPAQLRREYCDRRGGGLDYTEALEMAYENMLNSAKLTWRHVRPRAKKAKPTPPAPETTP